MLMKTIKLYYYKGFVYDSAADRSLIFEFFYSIFPEKVKTSKITTSSSCPSL